ncbi:hypothetical protein HYPDE_27948 [Hyphomicrobium denitrificans 1NES1]|uniref:Uncharacterized protein n=1 Tax=Hyphomicrobium denitrificans 1NES1 TaxID=670307 RepID=N0B1A7_9HYPH|nr:hypothetical protein HYPDE_27948 [Hyphomicrobium denitrificans 1NES1]
MTATGFWPARRQGIGRSRKFTLAERQPFLLTAVYDWPKIEKTTSGIPTARLGNSSYSIQCRLVTLLQATAFLAEYSGGFE